MENLLKKHSLKNLLVVLFLFFLSSCSDFSDSESEKIKELLKDEWFGSGATSVDGIPTYSYLKLVIFENSSGELRYKWDQSTLSKDYTSSPGISNAGIEGLVKFSYNKDEQNIQIDLYDNDKVFRSGSFKIQRDSIVKTLTDRIKERKDLREFYNQRKIQQTFDGTAEYIENMVQNSNKTILGQLWNDNYTGVDKPEITGISGYSGRMSFNLTEVYNESNIKRELDGKISNELERSDINYVLNKFKNGFKVYDANIIESKEVWNNDKLYTSTISGKPKDKYGKGYIYRIDGSDFDFLFGKYSKNGLKTFKGENGEENIVDRYISIRNDTESDPYYLVVIVETKSMQDVITGGSGGKTTKMMVTEQNVIDTYLINKFIYSDNEDPMIYLRRFMKNNIVGEYSKFYYLIK
jgi:hypothetical protein